jgi:hypothetical protein
LLQMTIVMPCCSVVAIHFALIDDSTCVRSKGVVQVLRKLIDW